MADALAIARRLQTRFPDLALVYRLKGDAEAAQKRWEPAAAMFRKALQKHEPGNTAVKLHVALLSGGNTAAAVQFAADWRSKHKTDSQFINHLGESALVAGDLPAAEALFNQVVEIDSKKRQRTEQSGLPRPQASELEGLGTGRACVAAALNDPLVLDTLMRAYADKGQVDRAVEVQRRAVELAPRNGGLRLYLARLHLRNNSKERARQELQALAQLGPAFTAQDEVAALMREATR